MAPKPKRGAPKVDPEVARAFGLLQGGDAPGAARLLQAAMKRKPSAAEPRFGLAMVAAQGGKLDDAVRLLREAIQRDGRVAGYHARLAAILSDQWEMEEAAGAIERARWLEPKNAEHHAAAAAILERLGRHDEGRQAAEKALAIDPANPRALIALTSIAVRRKDLDDAPVDDWRLRLERIGGDEGVRPLLRSLAWEALGHLCDAAGRDEQAFEAFVRTNETDALWQPTPTDADRENYLERTGRMADALTRERTERWAAEVPEDGQPSPALIVGFPRSGTTMTERALEAHPGVVSLEEKPTFRAVVRDMLTTLGMREGYVEEALDRLTPDQVRGLRARYWEAAARELGEPVPPGAVLLDKLPLRIAELGVVNRLFPNAPVIVALRDPRDVCLSNLRQRFRMSTTMSFSLTIEGTARLYEHVMGIWLRTRDLYTLPILVSRYEDAVAGFEPHMRRVVEFLGLPWDDAVLSFHERADERVANTPSYHAVREKVYTRAVGRWRRYRAGLAPILPTLEPFVEAFGYEPSDPTE
jgi:tetratricopeptide (TPR) repeat protein